MASIEECVCMKDIELLAEKKVTLENPMVFVNSGATDEQTLKENCSAFKKWRFQPQLLRNVKKVNLKTSLFGQRMHFPVGIAPTGLMKMFSKGGEMDAAKAASNAGTIFTQSTWASTSIEDIACVIPEGLKWFQLYVLKDRNLTKDLVKRAEKNGFSALVLTVDCPTVGKRYKILKNFRFPTEMAAKNIEGQAEHGAFYKLRDVAVTWDDFDWLKSITNLPIIVKGILTPEAALQSINHGAAAVWVSNHGGRQLDGVLPTVYALPLVAKAVNGRCPIFLDGGVRNGGDVAKAIALGADAVFVGRPIIWGAACGGVKGVQKVLEILRNEFELTMKLLGVTSVVELRSMPDLVLHESKISAKL